MLNLTKQVEELKNENKEKDEAILELSKFYQVSYFIFLLTFFLFLVLC